MEPPERLNALDATFLELEEADDSAHMHIGAVMILEARPAGSAPMLNRIRDEISARLVRLPRYRQRLSEPRTGGLRWPNWEDDPGFDIANHVFSAGLPAPGGIDELRHWAEDYFSVRLDRSRPLWELVVLDLADGRWAMASKTHHCLVDGVGSVDAAKVLLDTEPDPAPTPRDGEPGAGIGSDAEDGASGALDPRALAGRAVRVAGVALEAAGAVAHAAAAALDQVTHPNRLAETLRRSEAVVEVLIRDELVPAPTVSINDPIGARKPGELYCRSS